MHLPKNLSHFDSCGSCRKPFQPFPYSRESLASRRILAQVLDINQCFLDDPCSQKATKHILKSVWDTGSLLHGRWSCYVQMVNFGQQYWLRKKKFKESAKGSLWQILISGPVLPKLCLASTVFYESIWTFRKQYSLLTTQVISLQVGRKKKIICLQGCRLYK